MAASDAVVAEAKAAGVWIWGGGLERQAPTGRSPTVTREDALHWAAKLAAACRCAQEVRGIMYDPES